MKTAPVYTPLLMCHVLNYLIDFDEIPYVMCTVKTVECISLFGLYWYIVIYTKLKTNFTKYLKTFH